MKDQLFQLIESQKIAKQLYEDNRKALLEQAEREGVKVTHIFSTYRPFGGLTLAYRPMSTKGNMVEIAVVHCSKQDNFCRKTGTKMALEAFFNEATIKLPLIRYNPLESINEEVRRAFIALYYDYCEL